MCLKFGEDVYWDLSCSDYTLREREGEQYVPNSMLFMCLIHCMYFL